MLDYLYQFQIPFCVVATKADKVGKSELHKNLQTIANTFGLGVQDVIYVSSAKKQGAQRILERIETLIG